MSDTERSILLFFIVVAMVLLIATVTATSRLHSHDGVTSISWTAPPLLTTAVAILAERAALDL